MNPKEANALRWYLTRSNHGRGRFVGETSKFIKQGYLLITWTGRFDWTLTITHKGRQALMTLECPCPQCKSTH